MRNGRAAWSAPVWFALAAAVSAGCSDTCCGGDVAEPVPATSAFGTASGGPMPVGMVGTPVPTSPAPTRETTQPAATDGAPTVDEEGDGLETPPPLLGNPPRETDDEQSDAESDEPISPAEDDDPSPEGEPVDEPIPADEPDAGLQPGPSDSPDPASDCGSVKWACWPMPNPVGSGLPNEASYTNNGDGTVTDDVTGLMWEEVESSGNLSWEASIDHCEALSLAGFEDWRVPTRVEMTSIVDFSRSGTKVDADAFPNPPGAWHGTSSVWILTIDGRSSLDVSWTFNLSDGIVSNNFDRGDDRAVRCVRSDGTGEAPEVPAVEPPDHYTLLSDDEVVDNYTGLTWQRGDSREYLTWEQAGEYCAALDVGGESWRLPSIRELATLVDEATVAPAINSEVFPDTIGQSRSNDWYWASHQAVGSMAAWAINFDDGFTGFNAGDENAWNGFSAGYARCVR